MYASELSGDHLEETVQFNWKFPGSGVNCTVWGEIREIHHDPEGTTIWLSTVDEGTGDKTGFNIPPGTVVKTYQP